MKTIIGSMAVLVFLVQAQPAQADGERMANLKRWSTLQGQMASMVGKLHGLDNMPRKQAAQVMSRFRATLSSAAHRYNMDRVGPDSATQILQQGLLKASSHLGPVSKIGRERTDVFYAATAMVEAIRHTRSGLPHLKRTTKRLHARGTTQGLTAGEYNRLNASKTRSTRVHSQGTLYARQKVSHLFKLPARGQQSKLPSWRHPVRRVRAMMKK